MPVSSAGCKPLKEVILMFTVTMPGTEPRTPQHPGTAGGMDE